MSPQERIGILLKRAAHRALGLRAMTRPGTKASVLEAGQRMVDRANRQLGELGCTMLQIEALTEYVMLLDAQRADRQHHGQAALGLDLVAETADRLDALSLRLTELGIDLGEAR